MNLLFDNFETIAESPNGIKKLRDMILQLAVQGKLVKQDPNDEPASVLLDKIRNEKERLIREGKIKRQKPLPDISEDEKPFELPSGWMWCRLGFLGETQTGTTPSTKNPNNFGTFIPFIGPGDIKNGFINYNNNGLSEVGLGSSRLIRNKSILMVCIGGSIGKCAINDVDVSCNQQINTCTTFSAENTKYVYYALTSPYFQGLVIELAGGSATPIINKQRWSNITVPLPPLAEQKRIVEKVDSLMTLCNLVEKQQELKTKKHRSLNKASLNVLLNSKDHKEFQSNWDLITTNFDLLYTSEESIKQLKQAILQLAVQGKLVEQNSNFEDLKSKEERYPEKTGAYSKLPNGWVWEKIENVVKNEKHSIKRGPFGSAIRKAFFTSSGYKVYEQKHAIKNDFTIGDYYISKEKFNELRAFELKPNDIIISCSGTIGKVAIVPENAEKGIINQALLKLSLDNSIILNEYFCILFPAYFMKTSVLDDLKGTAIKNIVSIKELKSLPFPMPSAKEQKHILAKIDYLMKLCDEMSRKITASCNKSDKLAAAVINQTLNHSQIDNKLEEAFLKLQRV